jgi:uncharacterized protein (TIGR02246 family)
MRTLVTASLLVTAVLIGAATLGRSVYAGQAAAGETARIQALEDREAIRALLAEYGRTLDARDFAAFSRLFAKDAEFVGGAGVPAKGPEAIGALLGRTIQANYPDSKGRNLHLFANETIDVKGNEATAISKGAFVGANAENQPAWFQIATYRDQFVREDGRWKFKRHEIHGDIPVPRAR